MSNIKDFYNQRWEPLNWSVVNSSSSIGINDGYFVDTSLGSVTIYLPATAEIGDRVGISDIKSMFSTNRCIIDGNGNNINGYYSYFCSIDNITLILVYADNVQGWKITQSSGIINVDRKNHIINGNFDIWQRGTSQTSSGYGSDDIWYNKNNGSTKIHTRGVFLPGQTDVPNNPRYYSRTTVTSVTGSGNYVCKYGLVEGVGTLADEVVTLSFWAKANNNSKSISVSFMQDFGPGGSAQVSGISPTKLSITDTWKRYTVTAYIPSIFGKIFGADSNDAYMTGISSQGFLAFAIWFDAGTSFNTETSSLGHQSGIFDIAQVQLERGYSATNFEYIMLEERLRLCQRYFEILTGTVVPHDMSGTQRDFYFATWKRDRPVLLNIYFDDDYGSLNATFLPYSGFRRIFQNIDHPAYSYFSLWADSSMGVYIV
jgi:hypothetical protein